MESGHALSGKGDEGACGRCGEGTSVGFDAVKDGAAAIRTLGNGIDTSFLDLKGGTTGQVLSKASNTDLDFSWVAQDDSNAIQNAIVDAKGDLISATAADTPARLAVGTNGQVLTADSTTATGLKWAAASATSGPAFRANRTANYSISQNTWTKVNYNEEDFDSGFPHSTDVDNTEWIRNSSPFLPRPRKTTIKQLRLGRDGYPNIVFIFFI